MLLVYKVKRSKLEWLTKAFLLIFVSCIYFVNQAKTIYGGDAGDLVSAIVTSGIPHPPGYPLYTLLGVTLNKFLTVGTAAWKVGFLSSIPAIVTIYFLFDLILYLTKRLSVALISVLVLAFSYPFFLYSTVVEVFSLNNLFTVLLLWCFLHFNRENKSKYLYLGVFLLGLSFTHHHIILFILPAIVVLAYPKFKKVSARVIFISILLFFAGLIPYLYVFAAANSNPAINWMGHANISNFIKLVTRETYGTFRAGAFIANQPYLRLLDLYGFWNFAYKDFRVAGLLLFINGIFSLFQKERKIFYAMAIGMSSYLFFLFYASFPLAGDFIVGTFERFVLPLYIFITIFIAYGLIGFSGILGKILGIVRDKKKRDLLSNLALGMFVIYPLGILFLNYPKISILKNDRTAENLAYDILNNVPPKSIVLIAIDTPLFNSQYLYFTKSIWPEVILLHFSKLLNPNMKYQLTSLYPDLILPDETSSSPKNAFESFLELNYDKFPIFGKQAYLSDKGVWIPWGLLFRYYKNEDLPPDEYILGENEKIWDNLSDPLDGSLSSYKNLLLSDVIRQYTLAHQEMGFWAAKRGYDDIAQNHLLSAEKLMPSDLDSYNILSQVYIRQNKCDLAKEQIDFRISKDPDDESNFLLLSITYNLCYKDTVKGAFYQNLYEEKLKKKETPLEKL